MKTISSPSGDAMFASAIARWMKRIGALGLFAGSIALPAIGQAQVQFQSRHAAGLCLGYAGGKAELLSCQLDATQLQHSGYGMIGARVNDQYRCLESVGKERDLQWSQCVASPGKNWQIQPNGNLRNEQGWCVDIKNRLSSSNAVIQAYDCAAVAWREWTRSGSGRAPTPGPILAANLERYLPAMESVLRSGRLVDIADLTSGLVATGGGNLTFTQAGSIVAAAAADLVASGGGNIVASGGGNLGPQATALVASGGGNLQIRFGAGVVAAGGGNLVATGGGNIKSLIDAARLITNDGATFSAAGLSKLVSDDGASLTGKQLAQLVASGGGNMAPEVGSLVASGGGNALSLKAINGLVATGGGNLAARNPAFAEPLISAFNSRTVLSVPDSGWCTDRGFVAAFKDLVGREPANVTECDPTTYKGGAWRQVPAIRDPLMSAVADPAKLQKLANMVLGKWEGFKTGQPVAATPPPPPNPNTPPASLASGPCADPWVNDTVYKTLNRAARGSGKYSGECDINRYGSGSWSDYPDLLRKTQVAYSACSNRVISSAIWEAMGRAPRDSAANGECNPTHYNSGSWSSYDVLINMVRLAATAPVATTQPIPPPAPVRTIIIRSSYAPGKCLELTGSGAILMDCNGGTNQKFTQEVGGLLKRNAQCLGNSGNTLRLESCDGGSGAVHHVWRIVNNAAQNGNIPPTCLDIEGGSRNNGARVLGWACHGGPNQQWTFAIQP